MTKGFPACSRDGYPLVQINGRWECVAEYLDRCIGQKVVTDVVEKEGTIYYVFENGHTLPLLCFCCGNPLSAQDSEKERKDIRGRRLEELDIVAVELDNGEKIPQLWLLFSKKSLLGKGIGVPVSVEVAAQMQHPPDCPYQRKPTDARSPRRRKRRNHGA